MGKVRLKITPSLISAVNAQVSDWLILEEEVGEETTIGDLLASLGSSYADFRKAVFSSETGKVSDHVNIILNDTLLPFPEVTEAKLNNGDSIILLPVYTGG